MVKFRAWHKEKKIMKDVVAIFFDESCVVVAGIKYPATDAQIEENEWKFDEIDLVEWTGLQDSEGKEIYEADLISYDGKIISNFREFMSSKPERAPSNSWVVGSLTGGDWHTNYLELTKRGCTDID